MRSKHLKDSRSASSFNETALRQTGVFTLKEGECMGACGDAPVVLVNDVQMVSFMSDARLDELVRTCAQPSASTNE